MSDFERGFLITLLIAFSVVVWVLANLGNRRED